MITVLGDMMAASMSRVSERTEERVMHVGNEDFQGATVDETLPRLLDEHWEAEAVAAMDWFRATDPQGWAEYLAEADEWAEVAVPVADAWDVPAAAASGLAGQPVRLGE
ncbi:MAG TPA: hypothetical protein VG317_15080 [Pseudonocardiaceae bacterium]|nr:hypothetical protein [Pseudonocardiaceae bacterium]